MGEGIAIALEAIGALTVLIVIYAFAVPVINGMRLSLSFHATAFKGMRKSGRKVKWRGVPWSLVKHAYRFAGCNEFRRMDIRGDGYFWSSEGDRSTWDDRIRRGEETDIETGTPQP